jgi:hypothetical protein
MLAVWGICNIKGIMMGIPRWPVWEEVDQDPQNRVGDGAKKVLSAIIPIPLLHTHHGHRC